MMDVFFYEAFEEEQAALKRYLPDSIQAGFSWKAIQETDHSAPPARIISIRTQSVIPPEWAGKVDAILSRSTGCDHLVRYAAGCEKAPALGYLPCYCTRAVAEQAMILWSSLLRSLPRQIRQFERFERDGLTGYECRGRCLAVVGVGKIGYEVAGIAKALGMNVIGVDPVQRHTDIDYCTPEEAWPQADVVVCCMNLTQANHGYFSAEVFGTMRKGAIFVNVARGEMVRTADLVAALENGTLGGAGLDVHENENVLAVAMRGGGDAGATDSMQLLKRLKAHSNIILTPHNAFNTVESVDEKSAQSVQQVQAYLESGRFIWRVDL
jgi:D-lactate dehydrogenase